MPISQAAKNGIPTCPAGGARVTPSSVRDDGLQHGGRSAHRHSVPPQRPQGVPSENLGAGAERTGGSAARCWQISAGAHGFPVETIEYQLVSSVGAN